MTRAHAILSLVRALDYTLTECGAARDVQLAAARTLVQALEERTAADAQPLDFVYLPRDLPTFAECQRELVDRAFNEFGMTPTEAARALGVRRSTFYTYLKRNGVKP